MGSFIPRTYPLYVEEQSAQDKNLLRQLFVIKHEVNESYRRFHSWDWLFSSTFSFGYTLIGIAGGYMVSSTRFGIPFAFFWISSMWMLFRQNIDRDRKYYDIDRLKQDSESLYGEASRRFQRLDQIDNLNEHEKQQAKQRNMSFDQAVELKKEDERYDIFMKLRYRLTDLQNKQLRLQCTMPSDMQNEYVRAYEELSTNQ